MEAASGLPENLWEWPEIWCERGPCLSILAAQREARRRKFPGGDEGEMAEPRLSNLVESYPSLFSYVSHRHTGQVVSIFKLPPSRQRERKGQLIDRQGLQRYKVPHQLFFHDTLDGHLQSVLAAFGLTDEGHGLRIKADGNTAVGKVLGQVVAIASSRQSTHWCECRGPTCPGPDSCTPSRGKGTLLPIQAGRIVPPCMAPG